MPFQTLAGGCQVLALLQTSQRRSWLPVYALGDMFWYGNLKQIACTDLCAEELWKLMTKVLLFANMVPVDYSGFLETSAPSATYWKFLCNFSETWIAIFRKFIWTNSLPRFLLLLPSSILVYIHKIHFFYFQLFSCSFFFLKPRAQFTGLYYFIK